jgi:GTPase SAR1 family protein
VTRQASLEEVKMWQNLFKEHQDAPGVLVANKIDLRAARYSPNYSGRFRDKKGNR